VVVKTLMIALVMIMGQVLLDRIIQRAFPQHDHLRESLLLDGAHKPFAVGIEIRTARGQDDRLHTACLEQSVEGLRKLRVPVVNQVALTREESIAWIRPYSIGFSGRLLDCGC
jgi:hypothetical protein